MSDYTFPTHLSKHAWRKAVTAPTFPAEYRHLRATFLLLLPLIRSDGVLDVWQAQMISAAALPERTVQRHIAQAVEAGWMHQVVRGGNGRKSVYTVCVPGSCPPRMADKVAELSAIHYGQLEESCPPSGGGLIEESERRREHVAVDRNVEHDRTRNGHHPHNVSPPRKARDGDEWVATAVPLLTHLPAVHRLKL